MQRHTIVILEDDADTLELYASFLRAEGYDVLTVETGRDLIRLLKATDTPAAIIMDLGLPDARGVTLCRRIRAHREMSRIPIIAITGWSSGPVVDGVDEAPFNEVILKPALPAVVLEAVARWIPSSEAAATRPTTRGSRN